MEFPVSFDDRPVQRRTSPAAGESFRGPVDGDAANLKRLYDLIRNEPLPAENDQTVELAAGEKLDVLRGRKIVAFRVLTRAAAGTFTQILVAADLGPGGHVGFDADDRRGRDASGKQFFRDEKTGFHASDPDSPKCFHFYFPSCICSFHRTSSARTVNLRRMVFQTLPGAKLSSSSAY